MQTTLQWTKRESDERIPIVEIRDLEHCGKCRKHLTFRLGGEVIEIKTDEAGLKAISEAIAQHPETMKRKAQEKIKEAIEEARRLGLQIDDPSEKQQNRPTSPPPQNPQPGRCV